MLNIAWLNRPTMPNTGWIYPVIGVCRHRDGFHDESTGTMISMTEADRHFSRAADEQGAAVIMKNNTPRRHRTRMAAVSVLLTDRARQACEAPAK